MCLLSTAFRLLGYAGLAMTGLLCCIFVGALIRDVYLFRTADWRGFCWTIVICAGMYLVSQALLLLAIVAEALA